MIPSVATAISVDLIPEVGEINFGSFAMASCIPIVNEPFQETRRFKWNVENFIHKKMNFSYYVGEGPLYWYRIDWYPSICPPNPCIEMGPTISYIAPNCPYEIIENCIILPPSCDCVLPCIPGECISQTIEVRHMLATSVIHLCERINQECCESRPRGYIRRVRQYMRPALCCDVEKRGPGIDEWVDVDFLKCECGNLVDPCIAVIIYPCHVNRCGIHGPAFEGGPVPPISVIKMAPDLLGHIPMPIMQESVSAMPMAVEVVPPKLAQPVNRVINQYGASIPELIHLHHNLAGTNLFGDFLKAHKNKFDSLDLFYNKDYNSWHGTKTIKNWKTSVEWAPSQIAEKNGYKLNITVDNNNIRTKVSLLVKTDDFLNKKNNFEINCDFNTSSGTLNSDKSLLQFKIVKDDIGLFKNAWRGSLQLNLKG